LDDRTKELIAIGASVTAHCHPCIRYHLAKARELRATEDEIHQAIEVGKMVRRGATGEMNKLLSQLLEGGASGGCGCGGEDEEAARVVTDDVACAQPPLPHRGNGLSMLDCSGLWGGIEDLDEEIQSAGIAASLYSSSCDGGKGGDIYFFGACTDERLTRVALADVVGHGHAVSDVSAYMYGVLRAHVCDPDSGRILSEVNQIAAEHGLKAMTTAMVMAYSASDRAFYCAYAGHWPALLKRAAEATWSVTSPGERAVMGLPLGVSSDSVYGLQTIPVTSGDRLFAYTDGVVEATDRDGTLFGAGRLVKVLDAHVESTLPELKSAVLRALAQHTGNGLTHDDVTFIAMEVR